MKIEKPDNIRTITTDVKKNVSKNDNAVTLKKHLHQGLNSKILLANHIKLLDQSINSLLVQKSDSSNKIITPLLEILQLLGKSSLDPLDSDVLLMEKFILSWLDKHGEKLPFKQKRELIDLKNLFASRKMKLLAEVDPSLLSQLSSPEQDFINWKVSYLNGSLTSGSDEKDAVYCILNFYEESMGDLRIVLSKDRTTTKCAFQCSKKNIRMKIRKSFINFKSQLKERGLEIPQLHVGIFYKDNPKDFNNSKEGLEVWG